jgi:hypothetical protein
MPNGALRMRGSRLRGAAGRPSQPRAPRFSPHASRHRSSVDSGNSDHARPSSSAPSGATAIDSIRTARRASSSTSTRARASHGGRSSRARCTSPCTRSGVRRAADAPAVCTDRSAQPASARRSAVTAPTMACPSTESAAAAIDSMIARYRTRHISARGPIRSSCSCNCTASSRMPADSRPMRDIRSTRRTTDGSARGLVGGAGTPHATRATSSAGSDDDARSAGITASHTRMPTARSRSTSAPSITDATRAPSGVARPSRMASHTAAPRAPPGSHSTATASDGLTSHQGQTTGETTSPSCQADKRIASTAADASASVRRRTSSA